MNIISDCYLYLNMIEYSIISKNDQNILYKYYDERKVNNMKNEKGSVFSHI